MEFLASMLGVKQAEITYKVHSKATIFEDVTEIYFADEPYDKIEPGYESNKKIIRSMRGNSVDIEKNLEDSLRKSKSRIRKLANNNPFNLFVTLTMSDDRYDDEKTFKKLETWLKCERRRVGKFSYLLIFERHRCEDCVKNDTKPCTHDKSKRAIHVHGLIGNYKGELTPAINPKTGKQIIKMGSPMWHFPSYEKIGRIHNVEFIKDKNRIGSYITKYVTKDPAELGLNAKRYWASRDLKMPKEVDNLVTLKQMLIDDVKILSSYSNAHGYGYKVPTEQIKKYV